nr:site-specific DNA-methyltransferase [Schwartzia sp. (in: firmicutes)]
MTNFYETVLKVLKQDSRFTADDGTFMRNAVYEAAMEMDAELIRLLLSNEETSSRFFTDVDGVKVFDKVRFAWVINNRQFLPDSYTRFKNKVGLVDEQGEMISSSGKVELVFPYKDCVLEGGQTKEDQKRQEIFYNETLAPDEVDRLLYPKVLVNARRYTKDGDAPTAEFRNDDNLIIKGNNLLALASLRKRFEGTLKCIFIDPPYYFTVTKPSDTFSYNSNFKLSSWLIFMKNRLEEVRKLLANEGIIFISISDKGAHYLKVMTDDI